MKRFVLLGMLAACAIGVACSDDPASEDGSKATGDSGMKDSSSSSNNDGSATNDDSGPGNLDSGPTSKDSATDGHATKDAATDGNNGLAKECAAYCACMGKIDPCNNVFKSEKACNSKCTAQTNWDLTCRGTHCELAAAAGTNADRILHCGHAEGVGLCVNK